MKILHVITNLNTGGAEKLMVDLLPELRKKGHEVELCLFNGTVTPFYKEIESTGIKIHSFGEKNNYYSVRHIKRLITVAQDFDIIHTHNTAPQLFGAIASLFCKGKWITTEHTTTNHHRVWWYKKIEKWMYRQYARVICISEAAKRSMQEVTGVNKPPVTVIPNGINMDNFKNAMPVDKSTVNHVAGHKVILMVGRFSYQKDQATVIQAMKLIPENVELWLAGYGETQEKLESLIHELDLSHRVHLLGMRTDVPSLLKASDIVVQSSHIEGFGLAAVEAMAAGIPVIASNVNGLAQVVEGSGLLFEHKNAEDLAYQVNRLLTDKALRSDLIKKGRTRAQQYSIARMSEEYLNQYFCIIC